MAPAVSNGFAAAVLSILLLTGALAPAQETGAIPAPVAQQLQRMTRSAAVIFAGQVIAVRHPATDGATAQGTVTVEFRVDQAVRGCAQGSVYILREWEGLWYAAGERYRVGQRLLMFLLGPNTAGLSSPVNGMAGAVPLRGGGAAPGPYDTANVSPEWLVDLRWVEAHAMRGEEGPREPEPTRLERRPNATEHGAAQGDLRVPTGTSDFAPVAPGGRRENWIAMVPETERAMQPLSQVLRLCRGLEEPDRGAR